MRGSYRASRAPRGRVDRIISTRALTPLLETSRPSWARGLKQLIGTQIFKNGTSRPSWARGLKPLISPPRLRSPARVAPLVGAWIETDDQSNSGDSLAVAPLVGAWIETASGKLRSPYCSPSRPSWGRGLKQEFPVESYRLCSSSRPRGRGLKTTKAPEGIDGTIMSRPTWARGLKLADHLHRIPLDTSRPSWARGIETTTLLPVIET